MYTRYFHLVCENSQIDARTIENVLFDALVKIGAVSKDNADDPIKVGSVSMMPYSIFIHIPQFALLYLLHEARLALPERHAPMLVFTPPETSYLSK